MLKALDQIRIVEQGTFITGPCAGMMLADLGADVIKIESAGNGDPYRSFKTGFYSAHFQAYNRNKRAIGLDLKNEQDRDVFYQLIAQADVYIQNFRPGAAGRIGADYETLSKINPRLIYCSISGFGPDGPYAQRPVYDSVAQAVSGFLSVSIDPEQPRFIGPALADAITGIYASLGISAALIERGRTGKGKRIDISMVEAMMHFAVEPFMGYFALGEEPSGVDRPRLAQAFIVRCRDDKLFAFHLSSLDKFWDALVEAIEGEALARDERFSQRLKRIDNYDALNAELNAIFSTRTRPEWVERFSKFDVPFAPINTIPDVVNDPQAQHLEMFVPVAGRIEGAKETVRPAYSFDGEHAKTVRAAPVVNQHGDEIRAALQSNPTAWPALETETAAVAG
ncbi:CoA transferase [Neorhizobium galegae]|uniref:CaiB/BaiF CoA transferase family protein n=1 Tax=Neorhizobium galegae TaxID=399 RepID=UPI0006228DDD|nr:CoA transferase [Neorhizobium galegae]MCQ1780462.1 CoA transferase [Neorhizobium galegae]MCQ1797658.1 CoA transferase [Neorhizobium galegae]CDZ26845.1 CoA-transferase III family protein [Neorhizobium galegae bv. officinalis]CDZ37062.1 CoA-transferase III family protein [Neorhizobium galegae bv. officinalis]